MGTTSLTTNNSDIRQVPDNQEVYLSTTGFTSIVFDILERVDKPEAEALKYHLQDIIDEDAGESQIWESSAAHLSKLPYVLRWSVHA